MTGQILQVAGLLVFGRIMTECKEHERRMERCVFRKNSIIGLWGVEKTVNIFSQKQSASGTKVGSESS